MSILPIILLALLGGIVYIFINVIIRRLIAKVRSREDYDADVDGTMTEEEKKAAEEEKVIEKNKLKIGLKDVLEESRIKFGLVVGLGVILGGLVGYKFGFSIDTIIFFIFFAILTIITFVDLATMEIPPELNFIILGLGIINIFTNPEITWLQRLIGFFCISGFMLILTLLVKGAFGGGDIKLMAAAGVLLGWKGIVTAFVFGLFLGAAIGVVLIIRRKKGGKEHMPFGPSLCAGLVAASLFGSQLIEWYIDLIKLSMSGTYGD
ncbi:MAG: prepilin peptidase [Eubacterium sp.]|nr:prepilin peptidase [Eubacterium sp.]